MTNKIFTWLLIVYMAIGETTDLFSNPELINTVGTWLLTAFTYCAFIVFYPIGLIFG